MDIGFLFPGQGSQVVGMGKELAEHFPVAMKTFDEADEALDFSLKKICWEGPEDQLRQTMYTQPAIVTTSVACMRVLMKTGIKPAITAGHSVGEYSALVCAGSMSLGDAVRLTHLRGKLMETACPDGMGGMAAIIGFDRDRVLEIAKDVEEIGLAQAAGYNCPGQIVIAGHIRAISEVIARVKAEGASSATMLPVSGPFHSALMGDAGEGLAAELKKVDFKKPKFPVVCNVDAKPHTKPAEIKELLLGQLTKPVRWEESMVAIREKGIRVFTELGAGRVLTGLMRRVDRGLKVLGVRDLNSLEKTVDHFRANSKIHVKYTRPQTAE